MEKYEAPSLNPRTSSFLVDNPPSFQDTIEAPTLVNETSMIPLGFEEIVVRVRDSFVWG